MTDFQWSRVGHVGNEEERIAGGNCGAVVSLYEGVRTMVRVV